MDYEEQIVKEKHKFTIDDLKMWHADLLVTHKCGCGCKFCIDKFVDTSDDVTSLEDVEDYLRFLAEEERLEHPDMTSVLILGGEPTRVPFDYLKKVADLIHHYGFNATMTTNGMAGDKLLELDGYIDFINVSHYGKKANENSEYLYKFKKTEITMSKLITKEFFPTFWSFKEFVKEAKKDKLNYRFSTIQEITPKFGEIHPEWVDKELLPQCKLVPVLECLYAVMYEGYIIKVMHFHDEKASSPFPLYPHLYPNGNVNRDFCDESYSIDYKRDRKKEDYSKELVKYLDYSARNHWLERSYANYKVGICNPIYSTVLAENETMVLMSINKCFVPGTVSIASKKFHLSPLQYSDKEKEDLREMIKRVSSFLERKLHFRPLISEHAANHYEHIKEEMSKFLEIVPDSDKEKIFNDFVDVWPKIIKGDSGIHSHTLIIPWKLSSNSVKRTIEEMDLKKIEGYEEFFRQDKGKKYDYFIDNDGNFYFSNDDKGSYYYKKVVVRHCVALENGIPYLPSKPASNLLVYYPIIRETLELFRDFKYDEEGKIVNDGE